MESILAAHRNTSPAPTIEIVANASGLGLLRDQSPYANKVRDLTQQFSSVRFLACGIATETARVKEGKPVKLLPQAQLEAMHQSICAKHPLFLS